MPHLDLPYRTHRMPTRLTYRQAVSNVGVMFGKGMLRTAHSVSCGRRPACVRSHCKLFLLLDTTTIFVVASKHKNVLVPKNGRCGSPARLVVPSHGVAPSRRNRYFCFSCFATQGTTRWSRVARPRSSNAPSSLALENPRVSNYPASVNSFSAKGDRGYLG